MLKIRYSPSQSMIGINQAGDTIVEVLIAIAIVSLVLVGGYAATNRNSSTMQDTQEHNIAAKLVAGQVELLRTITFASIDYCFVSGIPTATNASCAITPGSAGSATYQLLIQQTSPATIPATYSVSATWDSLVGGKSNVTMYYRPN